MTREEIIRNLKYTLEKHKNDNVDTFGTNISVMCKDILDYLEQEPKAEWISEKVNVEDWKGCKRQYYQPISCSKCHLPNHYKSTYCPNCGARMERGDKE